jgi:hypothetical protein
VVGGLIATDVVALALIIVGWYVASGSSRRAQVPGINLAIGALALSAVAHGLWVCQARRAVGTYRVRILPAALVTDRPRAVAPLEETDPVASAEMALYHRPACLLVAGKAVARQPRPGHESAGRRPCGVCQP